ncbi:phage tail protein [Hyunsoonleella rubra]|uniref:Phage tail protein n=1 Tax=Hyunsoonleella rubra TaxID=1737062 RepID=A0ABW5T7Y6_9FLAO
MKKQLLLVCLVLASFLSTNNTEAQTPFIGEIRIFAGNFPPRGWAFCDGQTLPINQNTALFSILGTTYGGDGRTTFALPDLRGRAVIGEGNGPGLADRRLGSKTGQDNVTLTSNQIPSHNHPATTTSKVVLNGDAGASDDSSGQHIANQLGGFNEDATPGASLNGTTSTTTIDNAGSTQPHNNIQPSLGVHYIIALVGTFPSRS